MSQLLEDYNDLENMQILESDVDKGQRIYKLRGVFSKIGVVNKNRRVYSESVMVPVIQELQEAIREGGFVGQLNHPTNPQINMREISHKVTKLAISENGLVIGEMVPAGPDKLKLNSLLEDKIKCGVSTRGTGAVRPYSGPLAEGRQGIVEVMPGYKMRAIDIVFDPSAGTFPTVVQENTDYGVFSVPNSFKGVWDSVFNN